MMTGPEPGRRRGMVMVEDLLGPLNEMERKHAPERLWIGGDASIFELHTLVSVVGSRSASPEGIRRARRLARELVDRGIVVVSGLARGIDSVAHETAMEYGGRTVAVLATPLDQAAPPGNAALQERIHPPTCRGDPVPTGSADSEDEFHDSQPDDGTAVRRDDYRGGRAEQWNQAPGTGSDSPGPPVVLSRVRTHIVRRSMDPGTQGLWR